MQTNLSLTPLKKEFYLRPTLLVAEELLGKILVFDKHQAMITETEAYLGFDDEASHAFRGKTPRTAVMFAEGGISYVYFIYGKYYCLNLVTEKEGFPAAVLIRGAKLLTAPHLNLNGPGKLCQYLGITKEHHNGVDITSSDNFFVADSDIKPSFITTPRIGIKVATDKMWRFVAKELFIGL